MNLKSIKSIKEGDFIYEPLWCGEVTKVYKSGVLVLYSWENWAGTFCKNEFITFDELLNDNYKLIN